MIIYKTWMHEFQKNVHENAVAHGLWEDDRPVWETIALVHSEWSEALEEYRAGRPLVWYPCNALGPEKPACADEICPFDPIMTKEPCEYRGAKPEGIAVELIDGCIRLLDLAAHYNVSLEIKHIYGDVSDYLPTVVGILHLNTSRCLSVRTPFMEHGALGSQWPMYAGYCIAYVFKWIAKQGLNPHEIMMQKHEYNKTRPYKHGKKI